MGHENLTTQCKIGEDGYWRITCLEIPKLFLYGKNKQELMSLVPKALKILAEKHKGYKDVSVRQAPKYQEWELTSPSLTGDRGGVPA